MLRSLITLTLCIAAIACSQKPAEIQYHGDHFYGRFFNEDELAAIARSRTAVVRRGDSVTKLADQYDVLPEAIIRLNNLSDPYILHVGQVIELPNAKTHKVRKGESLSLIASRYKVSMKAMALMNDLSKPYVIHPGQSLRIPTKHEVASFTVDDPVSKPVVAAPKKKRRVGRPAPEPVGKPDAKPKRKAKKPTKKRTKTVSSYKSYSKPGSFIWPAQGKVVSKFGTKKGGFANDGINIAAKPGSAVRASASGEVVYVGSELKGYGNLVIIKHPGGWLTAYAHLDRIHVRQGEDVGQKKIIGAVGRSGSVSSPQLHFAVRRGRDPVDPLRKLPR